MRRQVSRRHEQYGRPLLEWSVIFGEKLGDDHLLFTVRFCLLFQTITLSREQASSRSGDLEAAGRVGTIVLSGQPDAHKPAQFG